MKKQIKIKPHIMILSGVWPHIKGNKEAANVICHEVASKMLDSGRFQMSYCVINAFNVSMPEIAGDEGAFFGVTLGILVAFFSSRVAFKRSTLNSSTF